MWLTAPHPLGSLHSDCDVHDVTILAGGPVEDVPSSYSTPLLSPAKVTKKELQKRVMDKDNQKFNYVQLIYCVI